MKPGTLLRILLLAFLVLDTGYSFLQHYHQPLDGDIAWNLLPDPDVAPILEDPLGVGTWRDGRTYANPNRFFCHWSFRAYLLHVPRWLQAVADPVTSVYLAAALAKVGTQLLLLLLLTRLVCGTWRAGATDFLVGAALLVPFFQANGFHDDIGIVDQSVTYTFFYALPAAALLLYVLPFTDRYLHGRMRPVGRGWYLTWALLAPVVCLSGPLNPGAVGVVTLLLAFRSLRGSFPPPAYLLAAGWLAAWAAYSLYVGTYNTLTLTNARPLPELFARLPEGVWRLLTTKLAWPLLLAGLGINYALLRNVAGSARLRGAYAWVAGFALLYLLLLPLGGYRDYRPLVVRYDTALPFTLAVLCLYAAGTRHLVHHLALPRWRSGRRAYLLLPLALGLAFTYADGYAPKKDACEREALRTLAQATVPVVTLPPCPVLAWRPFDRPEDSGDNVELLRRWRVVQHPLRYVNATR